MERDFQSLEPGTTGSIFATTAIGFQLILAGGFALLAFSANSFVGAFALLVMALGLLIGFIGFGMT